MLTGGRRNWLPGDCIEPNPLDRSVAGGDAWGTTSLWWVVRSPPGETVMTVQNRPLVACGACGKKYVWKAELAGRKVKCACGNVIPVPAAESDDPHDEYELADAPAEPQPA